MHRHCSRKVLRTVVFFSVLMSSVPSIVTAQADDLLSVTRYQVSDQEAVTGDLISFDKVTQTFGRSFGNNGDFIGVVIAPQVVILRGDKMTPIATTGVVFMNVTSSGGAISKGEYLTESSYPGKAKRAGLGERVVGVALERFSSDGVNDLGADGVYVGAISVLLSKEQPADGAMDGSGQTTGSSSSPFFGSESGVNTPLANLLKYFLAAVVSFGSIYLAFKNFGSTLRDSVVSVGRNPLARSSIQSMVVLNTVLMVVISAAGLFLGLMILLVQF